MQRFRIKYSKRNELRYTGNLDMQKVWERFLRRADLPVAYSQGYHPQPKIQQACPLPLGFFSEAELIDIWIDNDEIIAPTVEQMLACTGQPGIEIMSVTAIELNTPALQSVMASTDYKVELLKAVSTANLEKAVEKVLSSPAIIRERRGKSYDLRPLIEDLSVELGEAVNNPGLRMRLAAREGATGRPEEVLAELDISPTHARVTRKALFFTEQSPSRS